MVVGSSTTDVLLDATYRATYTYDNLLRSFRDQTVEFMLLALSECYVSSFVEYPVFDDRCADGEKRSSLMTNRVVVYLPLIDFVSSSNAIGVNVNETIASTNGLSPFFLSRGYVKSLLGGSCFNSNEYSMLVAKILTNQKRFLLRPDERVVLRAMRLMVVAVYELTYDLDTYATTYTSDEKKEEEEEEVATTAEAVDRTLKRYGMEDSSYLSYNGLERINALTEGLLDLSDARNVNELRLRSAIWTKRPNFDSDDLTFALVATSVLIDANLLVLSPLVDNLENGLYFVHNTYSNVGYLLLPSHVTPVFDRSIRLPMDTDNATDVDFRLCFLFNRIEESRYKLMVSPTGIASLLSDLLTYMFPPETTIMVDPFKYIRFDPFASRRSSIVRKRFDPDGSIHRCDDAKLWQILGALDERVGYVRTPVTYYSPFMCESAVSVRNCGLVPLSAIDENDSWKRYVYEKIPLRSEDAPKITLLKKGSDRGNLLITKNCNDRDWLIQRVVLSTDSFSNIPTILLIGWYVNHFDGPTPTLEKISSKRIYLFNGVLGLCEQPCKFFGSSKRKIPRYEGKIDTRHLADGLLLDGDAKRVRFQREMSGVTGNIDLPKCHFYNAVYRPICELDRQKSTVSLKSVGDFYRLTFQQARIWFPSVRLAETMRARGSICYADVPRNVIPLVDYYLREAVR